MRKEFAAAMEKLGARDPAHIFMTGDLGFMALEKVRESFGNRFVNAGVAEQNMVSAAAGLAHAGFKPWVYSIAPFATLRPYEQIRNDVCLHRLPVKIVGNGGGFGYGIMGATHHAPEDIAVMRVLPHMKVYLPCIAADVEEAVLQMAGDSQPGYLRLNLPAVLPKPIESFRPWRKVKDGSRLVVIAAGPIVGNLLELADPETQDAMEIWVLGQLPFNAIPEALIQSLKQKKKIAVLEEHQSACGIHEMLASTLLRQVDFDFRFLSLAVQGYPSGRYGSQRWHQEENGLAGEPLLKKIKGFLRG